MSRATRRTLTIGDVINLLRHKRGMTQAALAKAAGINERMVRFLEAGDRFPRLETLINLAESLGTRPSELLRRAGL